MNHRRPLDVEYNWWTVRGRSYRPDTPMRPVYQWAVQRRLPDCYAQSNLGCWSAHIVCGEQRFWRPETVVSIRECVVSGFGGYTYRFISHSSQVFPEVLFKDGQGILSLLCRDYPEIFVARPEGFDDRSSWHRVFWSARVSEGRRFEYF